jgi:hypothetical protein
MFKWNGRIAGLAVIAALALGVGCTSHEDPTSPSVEPPSQLLGSVLSPVLSLADLLTCSPQPYASTTKVVGREGGVIVVGSHVLTIPEGALAQRVTIKAEQMRGSVNSVRLSPEGLQFAKSAQLTMSYRNCALVLLPKRIAYTTELLKVIQLLPSLDLFGSKVVTSPIDHFSRYVVAY